MKNLLFLSVLVFCIIPPAFAQVGVGTTTPDAAIDINGTVRITTLPVGTTNVITLTGSSTSRNLNRTHLGANLTIIDNSLDTAPVAGSIGVLNLGNIPLNSGNIDNLDLEIAPGSSNSRATFIRLHSYSISANIAGITDGIHGRHITLFFSETTGISILEDSSLALAQNRILTAATSQLSLNGEGFIDLVYDEDAGSDALGRWIVIKFRG